MVAQYGRRRTSRLALDVSIHAFYQQMETNELFIFGDFIWKQWIENYYVFLSVPIGPFRCYTVGF